jgi:hypothetical protein
MVYIGDEPVMLGDVGLTSTSSVLEAKAALADKFDPPLGSDDDLGLVVNGDAPLHDWSMIDLCRACCDFFADLVRVGLSSSAPAGPTAKKAKRGH